MFKGYLYYFLNQQVSRINKVTIIEQTPKIKLDYIDTSCASFEEMKTLIDLKYNTADTNTTNSTNSINVEDNTFIK